MLTKREPERRRRHLRTSHPFSDDVVNVIDINWAEEDGRVTPFAVQCRTFLNGRWEQVCRIGNYHGQESHEHRFWTCMPPRLLDATHAAPATLFSICRKRMEESWFEYRRHFLAARTKASEEPNAGGDGT
jgi:hypothetical protein